MKSMLGCAFSLGSGIFSCASKKQATTKAKYVAATKSISQAIWLQRILEEMGEQQDRAICRNLDRNMGQRKIEILESESPLGKKHGLWSRH
ncbi:hypothetical protein CR513_40709, partial [Mucuna pruriens]